MAEFYESNDDSDFRAQSYQIWPPTGSKQFRSPTGQDFYLENNCKNVENIQKLTIESLFHDLCPVWKAQPQGTTNFDSN